MLLRRVSFFQIGVHLLAVLPGLWLALEFFSGRLGVNPIQALTLRTGKLALVMLMLSLACTPLNTLFGFRPAVAARRPLGLYAFLYALTHLLIFSGLDFGFDWGLLSQEVTEKPYIWVGLAAFSILSILAATSFRWWMKLLGKNWKRLHRLVYAAGALVVVHYAWVVKGDVLTLQGDILQPLAFGGVLALMLLIRLPAVRRWFASRKGGRSMGVQKRAGQAAVKEPPSQAG